MSGPNPERLLSDAALNGHLATVLRLLNAGVNPKAQDSQAVRLAAINGRTECLRLLLPVSDPKAKDSEGLRWAAQEGHVECVRLLIPVSDAKARNSEALRAAACHGHTECVKLLIPVSDAKTDDSWALQSAARADHLDIVDLLFEVSDPQVALEGILDDLDICHENPQDYPGFVYLQQKIQAQEHQRNLRQHLDAAMSGAPHHTQRRL